MLETSLRSFEVVAMPLLDHFHAPLYPRHPWESFHSNWTTRIADGIAAVLPPEFQVEQQTHVGPGFEIDVGTVEEDSLSADLPDGPAVLTVPRAPAYAPPAPDRTIPAAIPDTFEVRVFSTMAGMTLVAVVELVSPGNKDRVRERRAFATKCASFLAQGVSVVIVDMVSSRRANLHNETMRLLEADPDLSFPQAVRLYAVAYRPVRRNQRVQIDLWMHRLAVGSPLPTLPLRLTGDLFVPVELEATYQEACRRRLA
jgi:hypothetical protein